MNKIIRIMVIVSSIFLCSSCTQKRSSTLIKVLNNETDKELFYEVQTEVGTKGVQINPNSTDSVAFYYEYVIKWYPAMDDFGNEISVSKEIIYNLTDTTLFEYNYLTHNVVEDSEADLMFYKIKTLIINGTKVEVTDTFLQLLPKDYSMLEKFPEYYRK